jgi:hypothetical protein
MISDCACLREAAPAKAGISPACRQAGNSEFQSKILYPKLIGNYVISDSPGSPEEEYELKIPQSTLRIPQLASIFFIF